VISSETLKKNVDAFRSKQLFQTPNSEPRTNGLTRRHFIQWLLGLPLLFSFPFPVREASAEISIPPRRGENTIGEFFKGEELVYQIGAWIFKRVALGRLTFKEIEKGRYMAILQGETLGVLGWVARYRMDTYRSIMEEVDGGRCLRSLSFEEDVKIGSKLRRKRHIFDYQKRKWIQIRRRKDGVEERTEEEIPPGMVYDDFLTASYNFRYGVYGEIQRGKKYTVSTFPRKGALHYELNVAAREEEERKRKSEKVKDGKEFYVKLYLDPAITHSKEGLIEGWLSKDLYPTEGAIRNVILFGDVRGTLIQKNKG